MNVIIAIILYALGILACISSVIEWLYALLCKRGRIIRQVCEHARLQIASRRIWLLLASLLALLLLPFSNAVGQPPLFFAMSCICISMILRWLTPPTVLLLGVSGSRTNELLLTLRPAMFPGKVIHMLEMGDALLDPDAGYDVKLETEYSTSRATGSASWHSIVGGYLELCEHILVDMRHGSNNLKLELEMIGRLAPLCQCK